MSTKLLPDASVLHQLLNYDAETGRLFWKFRPIEMFYSTKQSQAHNAAIWNGKNAGKIAGSVDNRHGCRVISIFGEGYFEHRIIWKMLTGEEPIVIDHINGNTSDNRAKSIRSVSVMENQRNVKRHKSNSSGYNGVSFDRSRGLWVAQINVKGKHIHLGRFASKIEAASSRLQANLKYGFHENHGR